MVWVTYHAHNAIMSATTQLARSTTAAWPARRYGWAQGRQLPQPRASFPGAGVVAAGRAAAAVRLEQRQRVGWQGEERDVAAPHGIQVAIQVHSPLRSRSQRVGPSGGGPAAEKGASCSRADVQAAHQQHNSGRRRLTMTASNSSASCRHGRGRPAGSAGWVSDQPRALIPQRQITASTAGSCCKACKA